MKYEGEVLKVEQAGSGARVKLCGVRRRKQPDWDDDTSVIEIAMPLSAANRSYGLGRRVVVTIEVKG